MLSIFKAFHSRSRLKLESLTILRHRSTWLMCQAFPCFNAASFSARSAHCPGNLRIKELASVWQAYGKRSCRVAPCDALRCLAMPCDALRRLATPCALSGPEGKTEVRSRSRRSHAGSASSPTRLANDMSGPSQHGQQDVRG